MNLLRTLTMLMYLVLHVISLQAQGISLVSEKPSKGAFSLTNCSVMCDESDFTVVKKTAAMFAQDIEEVTGNRPKVITQKAKGSVILLGTLGKSKLEFTGSSILVIAPKEDGAGNIEIEIDEQPRAMVDLSIRGMR